MSDKPNIKPEDAPRRNFYGRRRGKALRKNQIKHLDTTLEAVSPRGVSFDENPDRNPLDLGALFGNDNPVWLEIGFGGGEHLLHMAQTYPDKNLLGVEAFLNGVRTTKILEKLEKVMDPELGINIVDLGLVYEIEVLGKDNAFVKMTFTTPACPLLNMILEDVKSKLDELKDVDIEVKVVFDPPWTPDRMSEKAKIKLGML